MNYACSSDLNTYYVTLMVMEIQVELIPRDGKVLDKPPSFPPLLNLHLELMENKKKLKKNLPLIKPGSVKKPPVQPVSSSAVLAAAGGVRAPGTGGDSKPSSKPPSKQPSPTTSPLKKKNKTKEVDTTPGDEDLIGELEDTPKVPDAGGETGDPEPGDGEPKKEKDALEDELGEDAETGDGDHEPGDDGDGEEDGEEEEEEDEYAGMTPEEKEAKQKEEYIWRFKIMKKKYKNKDIPSFNEHDDLSTMMTTYERTKKELELDMNVETYRNYLVGGFMITEFVCSNWMEIDFNGFTAQQMLLMDKYDSLLIELGERSYNRWHMNLPVEIRLIGFIIIQAGLFYLGKIIAAKADTSVAELFRGFTGQPSAAAVKAAEDQMAKDKDTGPPKKKMKGPSIKAEDVRKLAEDEDTKKSPPKSAKSRG